MPNYPGDARATQGKNARAGGARLDRAWNDTLQRDFFCRTCARTIRAAVIPRGWYTVERHFGSLRRARRLGAYCSIACLEQMLPRLRGVDAAGVLDLRSDYDQECDP